MALQGTQYTEIFVAKRADFQTRKLTFVDKFRCNTHLNHGNIMNTLSRTKITSQKRAM